MELYYGVEYLHEDSKDDLRLVRFGSREDRDRWVSAFSDPGAPRYREEISLEDIRIFTRHGVNQDCGFLV